MLLLLMLRRRRRLRRGSMQQLVLLWRMGEGGLLYLLWRCDGEKF